MQTRHREIILPQNEGNKTASLFSVWQKRSKDGVDQSKFILQQWTSFPSKWPKLRKTKLDLTWVFGLMMCSNVILDVTSEAWLQM